MDKRIMLKALGSLCDKIATHTVDDINPALPTIRNTP